MAVGQSVKARTSTGEVRDMTRLPLLVRGSSPPSLKGGALTIRGVTISVSAAVSLAALLFTELGREPMMVESVNNRGRHRPWGASFRHYFLCSQSSSRSLDPGLGSTADEAM